MNTIREILSILESMEESTTDQNSEISKKIKNLNIRGFGGDCPEAAIEINRKVFQNKGKIVGAVNKAMLEHGQYAIGHVAVLFNNNYWDVDAIPKSLDEIESWAMLDPSDIEYAEMADDFGFEWNDDTASEVKIIEFENEQELYKVFSRC